MSPAILQKNVTHDELSDVYYYDQQYKFPRQPLREPAMDSGLKDKIGPETHRVIRHHY